MSPWVDLGLPASVVVRGGLPRSQAPADLVGDMLEIDIPDGTTLEVGWEPEHDPGGWYRVVIFRGYWPAGEVWRVSTQDEVVAMIRRIVGRFVALPETIDVGLHMTEEEIADLRRQYETFFVGPGRSPGRRGR